MKHKVWRSEEEILAAIDRALEKANHCRTRCLELEICIRNLNKKIAKPSKSRIVELLMKRDECEKEMSRLIKRLRTLEDTTLPRLKRTLAAFRTRTFDFMGDYQGVVAA